MAFLKILHKSTMDQTMEKETIRLRLARGILLALDFEVGSDILKSILIPSVIDLTILAVVVAIRVVLSWSLSQEVDRDSEHIQKKGQMVRKSCWQNHTLLSDIFTIKTSVGASDYNI